MRAFPALLLLVLAGAPLAAGAEDEAEAAFVAWAAERAVPVSLAEGSLGRGLEGPLAQLVAGKRFVLLGELDHYVDEKYAFRLASLRVLHGLGWREVGMEMGRTDARRVERFLATGDERHLDEVGLYLGARDPARIGDGLRGFYAAERRFARGLRGIGAREERLRFFGYDLDVVRTAGVADAAERLAGHVSTAELARELAGLRLERRDARGRLERLLADLGDGRLARRLPADVAAETLADLDCAVESLWFAEEIAGGVDVLSHAAFGRREEHMVRRLEGELARLGAGARLVLLGHALHLSRAWEDVAWEEAGGNAYELWPTVGAHLAARFPGEVASIWLAHDRGTHLRVAPGMPAEEVASVPGTLEALLARAAEGMPSGAADAFLLPLADDDPRAAWLDEPRPFRVNGFVGHAPLRRMADAVLFVRETSAPRGD